MMRTPRTNVYRMSTAHPFQIGHHIVTVTHLATRLQSSNRGVLAQLGRINRVYRDDQRFAAAWPVVRVAGGELVYFDRRFFESMWRDIGLG